MALGLELNTARYLDLLEKLIGETEHLQNNPMAQIPEESRAIKHVLDLLTPFSTANGGPLTLDHVVYVEGRGNLIIGYTPEGASGTIGFVGSHLDVVPADKDTWERNPFELIKDGDKLYGRGTTDCLGHVALLADMFYQLAEKKPKLKREVWAVFIASEESAAIPGVGIDALLDDGKLDHLKFNPSYWIDSADTDPCMATASAAMWKITAEGHQNHASMPDKAINSIELGCEAVRYLQMKFYEDFPAHSQEEVYNFETPSTMKPTQISSDNVPVNQIPAWTEIKGDIRLTPFYSIDTCLEKVRGYIEQLNQGQVVESQMTEEPIKYEIPNEDGTGTIKGKLTFTLEGEPLKGIACDITSDSFKNLDDATREVVGESNPYSDTGSLPLVGDMQEAGFDIQITGYGFTHVYHGENEYCSLSAMQNAMKIFSLILDKYNQ